MIPFVERVKIYCTGIGYEVTREDYPDGKACNLRLSRPGCLPCRLCVPIDPRESIKGKWIERNIGTSEEAFENMVRLMSKPVCRSEKCSCIDEETREVS